MKIADYQLVIQYAMKTVIYGSSDSGRLRVGRCTPVCRRFQSLGRFGPRSRHTCVWTADFVNIPEVDARLALAGRPPETDPIQLTACDNGTNALQEQRSLGSLNVKTFLTKPFPAELRGKSDMNHISFLQLTLPDGARMEGWANDCPRCAQYVCWRSHPVSSIH